MLQVSSRLLFPCLTLSLYACVHLSGSDVNQSEFDPSKPTDKTSIKAASELQHDANEEFHVDPLPALGNEPDDFSDIDKRAADYRKDATVESEDARIERELREIHEAEAKTRSAEEKAAAEQRAKAAAQARKNSAAAAEHNRRIQRAAHEKAKKLPSIDDDQLEWNGLN